jgi:hypothetical protein
MFVKFSRFDTRKARRNPNQIVLNVVDDAEAPPVVPKACPRVTSGGQSPAAGAGAFSESREPPLSGTADMVRMRRFDFGVWRFGVFDVRFWLQKLLRTCGGS